MDTSLTVKARATAKSFFDERIDIKYARHTPAVNINETRDEYVLCVAAPGFQRDELAIEIKENIMCISSLRKKMRVERNAGANSRYEYDYSSWERKFTLPKDADTILAQALYMNGELLIHIPKHAHPQPIEFLKLMIY